VYISDDVDILSHWRPTFRQRPHTHYSARWHWLYEGKQV